MTSQLEVVDEHSFDPAMLCGLPVLDVGCRGFKLARHFASRGHLVVAVDPDPEVRMESPVENILTRNLAITSRELYGDAVLWKFGNGTANYLARKGWAAPASAAAVQVGAVDILTLMDWMLVEEWDLVKLDCEGEEYRILADWPGPVARQISVEFHEHAGRNAEGEAWYERVLWRHLSRWYRVVRHEKEPRHCAGENYWDTLLVRK